MGAGFDCGEQQHTVRLFRDQPERTAAWWNGASESGHFIACCCRAAQLAEAMSGVQGAFLSIDEQLPTPCRIVIPRDYMPVVGSPKTVRSCPGCTLSPPPRTSRVASHAMSLHVPRAQCVFNSRWGPSTIPSLNCTSHRGRCCVVALC